LLNERTCKYLLVYFGVIFADFILLCLSCIKPRKDSQLNSGLRKWTTVFY